MRLRRGLSFCRHRNESGHTYGILGLELQFQARDDVYMFFVSPFAYSNRHIDIKTFISLRRYETLSLHTLLQGLRTSDCDWLALPDARNRTRVPVSDSLKRRELLEDFIFWYFDGFLLPLLKAHFYITESGAFRNRVLYFRHDDWETLCKPLVEKLCGETFQKLSQVRVSLEDKDMS